MVKRIVNIFAINELFAFRKNISFLKPIVTKFVDIMYANTFDRCERTTGI